MYHNHNKRIMGNIEKTSKREELKCQIEFITNSAIQRLTIDKYNKNELLIFKTLIEKGWSSRSIIVNMQYCKENNISIYQLFNNQFFYVLKLLLN